MQYLLLEQRDFVHIKENKELVIYSQHLKMWNCESLQASFALVKTLLVLFLCSKNSSEKIRKCEYKNSVGLIFVNLFPCEN